MNVNAVITGGTASPAHDGVTGELAALAAQLQQCRPASGLFFALGCAAEAVRVYVATHVITTILLGLLLMEAVALAA